MFEFGLIYLRLSTSINICETIWEYLYKQLMTVYNLWKQFIVYMKTVIKVVYNKHLYDKCL